MFNMESFVDELIKIAGFGESAKGVYEFAKPLAKAHWKPAALITGGGGAALAGKRGFDDIAAMESLPVETRQALLAQRG